MAHCALAEVGCMSLCQGINYIRHKLCQNTRCRIMQILSKVQMHDNQFCNVLLKHERQKLCRHLLHN